LKLTKTVSGKQEEVKFEWDRGRLYDKMAVWILYEKCLEAVKARVTDIQKNRRYRGRP
jgi:DNA topoisomerase III